ncbi:transmembrane protein 108 [Lethenteron reissneri]|uniref:transmembrane protein 108 n=1 Tax=Lethenteron reissneri TaxID=7753 RepID=UPI002AB74BC2|nr:transmembrane protein 108 [Lethenteron reissneri]
MLQTGLPSPPGAGFIVLLLLCRGWVCGAELRLSQGDSRVPSRYASHSAPGGAGEEARSAAAADSTGLSAWTYQRGSHTHWTSALSTATTPDSASSRSSASPTPEPSAEPPRERGAVPLPASAPAASVDAAALPSLAASRTPGADASPGSLPGDVIQPTMVFGGHYGVFSTALPAEASSSSGAMAGGAATTQAGDSTPALQITTWTYGHADGAASLSSSSSSSSSPVSGTSEHGDGNAGPRGTSVGPRATDDRGAAPVAPSLSSGTVPSWTDTKLITTATAHTDGPAAHFHWLLRRADIAWIVTAITVVVATSVLGGVLCVSRRRKEASHERNLSYWNEAITLDYFRHAVQLPQDLPYGTHPTVATISLDEMALPEEDGGLTFINTFAKGVTFADGHRSTEL